MDVAKNWIAALSPWKTRPNIGVVRGLITYSTRFQQTGKVDPVLSEQRRELRKLSVHEEIYTVGMVLEDPSMYFSEVCHELEEAMGVVVTPPTLFVGYLEDMESLERRYNK